MHLRFHPDESGFRSFVKRLKLAEHLRGLRGRQLPQVQLRRNQTILSERYLPHVSRSNIIMNNKVKRSYQRDILLKMSK